MIGYVLLTIILLGIPGCTTPPHVDPFLNEDMRVWFYDPYSNNNAEVLLPQLGESLKRAGFPPSTRVIIYTDVKLTPELKAQVRDALLNGNSHFTHFGFYRENNCTTSPPSAESPAAISARLDLVEARLNRLERMVEELGVKVDGVYVIQPADTAATIAQTFRLTLSELEALNPGIDWSRVRVGERIRVR